MPHETFVAMHGGARPTKFIDLGSTDIPQVNESCTRVDALVVAEVITSRTVVKPSRTSGRLLQKCHE